jgi:hypothetical protein
VPVSRTVFSPLSTIIQPGPETLAAVLGAPPRRSCTTVSRQTPAAAGSISQLTRLGCSPASSGSYSERHSCTSRRGGSHSSTGPSPHRLPSGPYETCRSGVFVMRAPWKYAAVRSGSVIAAQSRSGEALMKTW